MIACIRLLDFHAKCSVHAGLAICYCLYAEDFRGSVCRRRRDVSFRARRRIFFVRPPQLAASFTIREVAAFPLLHPRLPPF